MSEEIKCADCGQPDSHICIEAFNEQQVQNHMANHPRLCRVCKIELPKDWPHDACDTCPCSCLPELESKPEQPFDLGEAGVAIYSGQMTSEEALKKVTKSKPEQAGEWKVESQTFNTPLAWIINIDCPGIQTFDLYFPKGAYTKELAEQTAKRIVEDHNDFPKYHEAWRTRTAEWMDLTNENREIRAKLQEAEKEIERLKAVNSENG